jgi:hypothetical protein
MRNALARLRTLLVCSLLALTIAACAGGASTGFTTAGSPPFPKPLCQVAVPGSTPVSGTGPWANVPFRPNSTGKVFSTIGGGIGQFTITTFTICASATAAADIAPFYAAQMPANGWDVSPDFPTDGQLHQTCASPCWQRESKTRKATIATPPTVAIAGTTTYQLVVATPPHIPVEDCRKKEIAQDPTPNEFTTTWNLDVPLPPLSTSTVGAVTLDRSIFVRFCSAGTPASVTAFFNAALPTKGWVLGSFACPSGGAPMSVWVENGNRLLRFTIPDGGPSYPVGFKWSLTYCE